MVYSFYILALLVAAIFCFAIGAYQILHEGEDPSSDISYRPREFQDNLQATILSLINDEYSPFSTARLHDHLYADLSLDSLDVNHLIAEISEITETDLSVPSLHEAYGHDPTISQLVAYVRSRMDTSAS